MNESISFDHYRKAMQHCNTCSFSKCDYGKDCDHYWIFNGNYEVTCPECGEAMVFLPDDEYNKSKTGDYACLCCGFNLVKEEFKPVKFFFTPGEAQIIDHRLEVPDALAEALELDSDYVYDVCLNFETQLKAGFLEYKTENEKAIFEDCIEGSTVFGNYDYMEPAEKGALNRAVNSIEKKTGVTFPRF
jgi:hypothetical protein